jgi:NAD(P)-dependent dehydrogenase (short-subunit alcohol dehydrogenase family)
MPDALIWGASGGIGSALVEQLTGQGWRVFGAARDERRVPESASWRGSFDATDDHSFETVAYGVGTESSGLKLVVYAAGVMDAAPLDGLSAEAWARMQAVNLSGPLRAAQASLPLLQETAAVIAIGAQLDKITLPKFGAYAASKAGLEALYAVLAKEQRRHAWIVVRPGAVDTPFWANVPFALPKSAQSADAVAKAIIALAEVGKSGAFDI